MKSNILLYSVIPLDPRAHGAYLRASKIYSDELIKKLESTSRNIVLGDVVSRKLVLFGAFAHTISVVEFCRNRDVKVILAVEDESILRRVYYALTGMVNRDALYSRGLLKVVKVDDVERLVVDVEEVREMDDLIQFYNDDKHIGNYVDVAGRRRSDNKILEALHIVLNCLVHSEYMVVQLHNLMMDDDTDLLPSLVVPIDEVTELPLGLIGYTVDDIVEILDEVDLTHLRMRLKEFAERSGNQRKSRYLDREFSSARLIKRLFYRALQRLQSDVLMSRNGVFGSDVVSVSLRFISCDIRETRSTMELVVAYLKGQKVANYSLELKSFDRSGIGFSGSVYRESGENLHPLLRRPLNKDLPMLPMMGAGAIASIAADWQNIARGLGLEDKVYLFHKDVDFSLGRKEYLRRATGPLRSALAKKLSHDGHVPGVQEIDNAIVHIVNRIRNRVEIAQVDHYRETGCFVMIPNLGFSVDPGDSKKALVVIPSSHIDKLPIAKRTLQVVFRSDDEREVRQLVITQDALFRPREIDHLGIRRWIFGFRQLNSEGDLTEIPEVMDGEDGLYAHEITPVSLRALVDKVWMETERYQRRYRTVEKGAGHRPLALKIFGEQHGAFVRAWVEYERGEMSFLDLWEKVPLLVIYRLQDKIYSRLVRTPRAGLLSNFMGGIASPEHWDPVRNMLSIYLHYLGPTVAEVDTDLHRLVGKRGFVGRMVQTHASSYESIIYVYNHFVTPDPHLDMAILDASERARLDELRAGEQLYVDRTDFVVSVPEKVKIQSAGRLRNYIRNLGHDLVDGLLNRKIYVGMRNNPGLGARPGIMSTRGGSSLAQIHTYTSDGLTVAYLASVNHIQSYTKNMTEFRRRLICEYLGGRIEWEGWKYPDGTVLSGPETDLRAYLSKIVARMSDESKMRLLECEPILRQNDVHSKFCDNTWRCLMAEPEGRYTELLYHYYVQYWIHEMQNMVGIRAPEHLHDLPDLLIEYRPEYTHLILSDFIRSSRGQAYLSDLTLQVSSKNLSQSRGLHAAQEFDLSLIRAADRMENYLRYTELSAEQVKGNFLAWVFAVFSSRGPRYYYRSLTTEELWYLAVSTRAPNLAVDVVTKQMAIVTGVTVKEATSFHVLTTLTEETKEELVGMRLTPDAFESLLDPVNSHTALFYRYDWRRKKIIDSEIAREEVREILQGLFLSDKNLVLELPSSENSMRLYDRAIDIRSRVLMLQDTFLKKAKEAYSQPWADISGGKPSRVRFIFETIKKVLYTD